MKIEFQMEQQLMKSKRAAELSHRRELNEAEV